MTSFIAFQDVRSPEDGEPTEEMHMQMITNTGYAVVFNTSLKDTLHEDF